MWIYDVGNEGTQEVTDGKWETGFVAVMSEGEKVASERGGTEGQGTCPGQGEPPVLDRLLFRLAENGQL